MRALTSSERLVILTARQANSFASRKGGNGLRSPVRVSASQTDGFARSSGYLAISRLRTAPSRISPAALSVPIRATSVIAIRSRALRRVRLPRSITVNVNMIVRLHPPVAPYANDD